MNSFNDRQAEKTKNNKNGPFKQLVFNICRSILAHDSSEPEPDSKITDTPGNQNPCNTEEDSFFHNPESSFREYCGQIPLQENTETQQSDLESNASFQENERIEKSIVAESGNESSSHPAKSDNSREGKPLYLSDPSILRDYPDYPDLIPPQKEFGTLQSVHEGKASFQENEKIEMNTASESGNESSSLPVKIDNLGKKTEEKATEKEPVLTDTPVMKKNSPPPMPLPNVSEVQSYLKYNEVNGKKILVKDICNDEMILEKDNRFADKICFNEFLGSIVLRGDVPWNTENSNFREWTDIDDASVLSIVQRDYGIHNRADLLDAIKLVANRHRFNPIKEMLESFTWDGKEHIRKLLPYYLGAEDSDYTYQVMRLGMLTAVKRIYEPGAKADSLIILYGSQGLGKSVLLRELALSDEFFSDSIVDLDGDTAAKSLRGVWIVELGELKALQQTKGGEEAVKRFISATQDRLRFPYERRYTTYPRQFALFGTTNSSDCLNDFTGNRRYLIIDCGITEAHTADLFRPSAMDDIKSAWAEAVHIYKTEHPDLDLPGDYKAEADAVRERHMTDTGEKGLIFAYLENKDRSCSLEIWEEALHMKREMTQNDSRKITDIILSDPAWEHTKAQRYKTYGNQRLFRRKQ